MIADRNAPADGITSAGREPAERNAPGRTAVPTPRPSKEVIDRWEGEGGRPSGPSAREVQAAARDNKPKDIDKLEDQIMAADSPDGLPPPKAMRRREWRMVRVVALCVFVPVFLIGAAMISVETLLAACALLLALFVAAFPVWTAALMRAKEHQEAREEAEVIVVGGPVGQACAVDPAHAPGPSVSKPPVAR